MLRSAPRLIAAIALAWIAASPVHADERERILSFDSDIEVRPDASMTVRERIRAFAAGKEIRHGIYRDFPTRFRSWLGVRTIVGFDVLEVRRDGAPEDFHLASRENGVRVYIGREGVDLPPGVHTFEIAYRTTRQLGFFADHDEIYWNVTGNGWAFPIGHATARVRLPTREVRSTDGYTGAAGAKDRSFVTSTDAGTPVFATTRPLAPGEGLTIVVSFPKGVVAEPTSDQRLHWLLEDNRGTVAGLVGLLVLLLYYLAVWARVGKDPEVGTLVVRYEPPRDLSPAGMRFLVEMGFDDRTFASAVLDLAVKRTITISEQAGVHTVARTDGKDADLPADEKVILTKLFQDGKSVELRPANHVRVGGARLALQNALRTSLEKIYFRTNGKYLVPGVVLSILAVAATFLGAEAEELATGGFMSLWLTGWTFGVVMLARQTGALWRTALLGPAGRIAALGGALFMTAFSTPFFAGELVGLYMLSRAAGIWVIVILAAAVALGVLFHELLKAPTSAGRKLLDEVDGFRAFLGAVEGDRLRRIAPERTPQLFEKYLPYAFALGVEQAWAEQFSDVLGRAASEYRPDWYTGDTFAAADLGGFATGIGSSLCGAIASASTAPGSSSGGGGGGSSGGGGGGGGGGGW